MKNPTVVYLQRNYPGGLSMEASADFTLRYDRAWTTKVGVPDQGPPRMPSISCSCHFLPRIPMSWTFLRETFWWSSWKERMAGGLWNGTDSVALSLGPTWRRSEEKKRLVPTHLCSDGEVRTVLTTAQASWGTTKFGCPGAGCWLLPVNFSQEE